MNPFARCPRPTVWTFSKLSLGALLIALGFDGTLVAAEKYTASAVEPLYRAHRFATQPKLNPETTFAIQELEVPDLWSKLQIQLFVADDMIRGQSFASRPFLVIDGAILSLFDAFAGERWMSGVVDVDAFYYSYSWGSGMHRSLVGRLTLKDRKPLRHESEPLYYGDMFVEKTGHRIRVVKGRWKAFNRWENANPLGWIDVGERTRLKIIDDRGAAVAFPLGR